MSVDSKHTRRKDRLRELPSVDRLLLAFDDEIADYGRQAVTAALRDTIEDRRNRIIAGERPGTDERSIRQAARQLLRKQAAPTLQRVFNLTGTVLHTNLGRALLPAVAIDAIRSAAADYCSLEFDLDSGERGDRETHVERLTCELTGAESATVVNNNAAAVLLALNTLAMNREVPVSRGELVEIGGSFRIPEVMQRANCTLVEVGTTNRTHPSDYRNAINERTALLMKVHTSNYRIQGFVKEVAIAELATLAAECHLPFVMDLGSGSLVDLARIGLPKEPAVAAVLKQGPDLVTFSGDKLLGGPQCGLIAGSAELIARIKANPLKRALRLDKLTLAGLAEVLNLYRDPDNLVRTLPTLSLLTRSRGEIRSLAERIAPAIAAALGESYRVEVVDTDSQVGSGSLPVETLPSAAIGIAAAADGQDSAKAVAAAFRALPVPVIGHIRKGRLLLDLRCLDDEAGFVAQLELLRI